MKLLLKYALILSLFVLSGVKSPNFAFPLSGIVEKLGYDESHQVIDSDTGLPIDRADIKIPSKGYRTKTDSEGKFELKTKIKGPTILSVEKDGYKPFSLTVNEQSINKSLKLGISKSKAQEIVIENNLFHLGDNSFSENSANAGEFRADAAGPSYTKKFYVKTIKPGENAYLEIGSIIGIDTLMARTLKQNNIESSYASPPKVYFNSQKIAEININGDGQKIKIPRDIINQLGPNEVTIRTGRNLFQTAYVDYDDIEFMNLFLTVK